MDPILDQDQQELELALLRAGRDVGMSTEMRAKTLAALGVGAAGVATATSAKASTLGWFTSKVGAAWTAGVLGALGLAGSLALNGESADGAGDSTVARPVGQQLEAVAPNQDEPTPRSGTTSNKTRLSAKAVELKDLAEINEQDPTEPARRQVRTGKVSSPTSRLRDELSHISRVESALRAGSPQKALSLLKEYRSRFPRRQLGLEAEVLTIQAMAESGSLAAASRRAQSFLERHPNSPLGARAKQYLRE